MNLKTIFSKTGKGMLEMKNKTLPKDISRILTLVDGKSKVGDLLNKEDRLTEVKLREILKKLESDGYIKVFSAGESLFAPGGDLDFTKGVVVSEIKADAYNEAKARQQAQSQPPPRPGMTPPPRPGMAQPPPRPGMTQPPPLRPGMTQPPPRPSGTPSLSELARTEGDARAKKDAEEKARKEAEARAKAETEARLRAEAEAKVRREAEAKARAETEARAKAEAEAKAKREAEAKIRAETEARVRAEADAKAKREAEAKAKAEADAKARKEAEAKAKAEAEARAKAEADAKAKREAEAKAKSEAARWEAEVKAKAEAEARAKVDSEALAKADADAKARKEAEEKAQAEARRKQEEAALSALFEEEARAKIASEAKGRKEEGRARPEMRSRDDAETRSRGDAEKRMQAEIQAQLRAGEAAAKAEEDEKFRKEARAKAEEETWAKAEAEIRASIQESAKKEAKAKPGWMEEAEKEEQKRRAKEQEEFEAKERAKIEEKARAEAEALRVAKAKAKAEEEVKEKAAAKRAARKPFDWKPAAIGLSLLFVAAVALIHFIPFNTYIPAVEKLASDTLHEPVTIDSLHITLLPTPQVQLQGFTIGKLKDIRINTVRVSGLDLVLSGSTRLDSVEMDTTTLEQDSLARLALWGKPAGSAPALQVSRVIFKNVRLALRDIALAPLQGEISLDKDGAVRQASMRASDGKISAQVSAKDQQYQVNFSARGLQLPIGPELAFESLDAQGVATSDGMQLTKIDARLYDGSAKGNADIRWDDGWGMSGNFEVKGLDLAPVIVIFARNFVASGTLDGKGQYVLQAKTLNKLFSSPRVDFRFNVAKGSLNSMDLTRALQSPSRTGVRGGKTLFTDFSGILDYGTSGYQFKDLHLVSGPLSAVGSAEITTGNLLSGRMNVELKSGATSIKNSFVVSGNLNDLVLRSN